MNKINFKKLSLVLLIVFFATSLVLNREYCSQEHLNALLAYLGPWSPLVFILLYSIAPVLFIPGTVMTLIGGFIFGTYWGFLYSMIGGVIGASLAFLVGRYIADDWVEGKSHSMIENVKRGVKNDGWRYIAFTRLVPIFPYSILNYAFGLTKISLVTFALTSFISLIPGTLAYSYIGYVGQEAAQCSQGLLLKVSLVIGFIILISFFTNKAKAKIALEL